MTETDLQTALNAGGVVTLPGGVLTLTAPLTITGQRFLRVIGNSTKLQWQGPAGVPALTLAGCSQCVLEGFRLSSSSQYPLAEAIRFQTLAGSVSTGNVLRDLDIDGTTAAGLGIGVQWAAGTAGDANNDFTGLERVRIANYSGCALSVEHSQSVGHSCRDCTFYGYGAGARGMQVLAGSASFQGGFCGGHTDVDFFLEGLSRPAIISADSEGSNRFLTLFGPTGAPYRVHLLGCRVAGDKLNADGCILLVESPGPVLIDGCMFGDGWQGQGVWPHLAVNAIKPVAGRMAGCMWSAHGTFNGAADGAYVHPSVTVAGGGLGDFLLQGNLYADANGQAVAHVGSEVG